MARATPSATSTQAVMQTLSWLRRQEFKPVPLRPGSKAAASRDYADKNYLPPGDDLWRGGDYGVGVVCGPAQGGPVDVDLDCVEAVFLAPSMLPQTPAVFGRESKRASHYLYRVDAQEFAKKAFVDPVTKSTILELRGDGGHQTVMPGSIHEGTGETVAWDKLPFPEVIKVDPAALGRAARRLAMAVLIARHLWSVGQRNEVSKHLWGMFYYLDWKQEECEIILDAVMRLTGDTDKTRLLTLRSTYAKGEKGGRITGAATLRKFLGDDALVDRIADWAGSVTANLVQQYNEKWAVVSFGSKFRVVDTEVKDGEQPTFYAKEDFLNLTAPDVETLDDKPVPRARMWLANPRRRTYRTVDFLPGVEDAGDVLNLWTGWGAAPDDKGSCSAWCELLQQTICGGDDDTTNWLLHWFANILREPMRKPLTAPVIIGRQGAGKTLLFSYFGKILGPAYMTVTNEEHVYGRFNSHLSNTLLLHSEEALYGGEKRHRGIIKSLITDEFRVFEPKGVDARRVRNYLRLALTSNEVHAAPVEAGDRRFTVIDMKDRKVSDELKDRVIREMHVSGPAALHHHLITADYDPFLACTNLKSEALHDVKGVNFTPMEEWWYTTLCSGSVLPDYLGWAQIPTDDPWPSVVSSPALYAAMALYMKDRSVRAMPNAVAWALQLSKMVGVKLIKAQRNFANPMSDDAPQMAKLLSSRQNAILNLPALDECRKAFENVFGQPISWPEDGEPPPPRIKDSF